MFKPLHPSITFLLNLRKHNIQCLALVRPRFLVANCSLVYKMGSHSVVLITITHYKKGTISRHCLHDNIVGTFP